MAIAAKSVREIVIENPSSTKVFEQLGIDYCCGGDKSLEQACLTANLDVDRVLDSLEESQRLPKNQTDRDWQNEPLATLIAHIESSHHKYTRDELARLGPLLERVYAVHGKKHPELLQIQEVFEGLYQELIGHMMKEEMVLFPYIKQMEAAMMADGELGSAPFGSVQNPIATMKHEHDSAGGALRTMREASGGYLAPADACLSFQTLYRTLAEFEADLHQHIHLENNILFPRAMAMESAS